MSLREQFLPTIADEQAARKAIKYGARAGYGMAVLVLLGALLLYFAGLDSNGGAIAPEDMSWALAGVMVEAALAAFLAFRIQTGKGWFAGSLLLSLWVIELLMKVASGRIAFLIVHLALMAFVINGIRGCWFMRRAASPSPAAS